MLRYLIFLGYDIVLIILLTVCHSNKNDTAHTSEYPITIDIDEAIRNKIEFHLSDLIDSITYIPVESIIGDYVMYLSGNMLKISQNYIISENYLWGGDLVLFDRNGRFIRKIAQRGQGPGEYNFINDMAIDETHETVYVLSMSKLFKYNLEGKFLGVIDLSEVSGLPNLLAQKIAVSPSGQILVNLGNRMGDLRYRCLLLDDKGNLVNMLKNNLTHTFDPNVPLYMAPEGTYYIYNDRIHIKNICDTLFVVENDSFQPKYVFKTGGKNQSNHITHTEYVEKIQQFAFGTIFETDSKVFFQFRLNEKIYNACYDKKERKAYSNSLKDVNEFFNDMDVVKYFTFGFSDYQFNDIIIQMRTFEFIDRTVLKANLSPPRYLEVTHMLDSLQSVDESPVVLSIFHLKK